MALKYLKPIPINLKSHPQYDEKWVQERIADDPAILGLGDLILKDVERMQRKAGRLDLLLYEPESGDRYEVELMLGSVDGSYIIRTLEYWDNERKRYAAYKHYAVIVAEDINSRFLNVISLFNNVVPIIAIQLSALQVGDNIILSFTIVLNVIEPGEDDTDDNGGQTTTREYWEGQASKEAMGMVDRCLSLLQEADTSLKLNYRKRYVGVMQGNRANNFILFYPKKKHIMAFVIIGDHETWKPRLEEAGVIVTDRKARKRIMIKLDGNDIREHQPILKELFAASYQERQD